jgi:hypothetical protein
MKMASSENLKLQRAQKLWRKMHPKKRKRKKPNNGRGREK